jgi:uncharacterized DUF497 family protein
MITWTEAKRQANIADHGLDFVGADAVFDHPVLTWEDTREAYGEQRIVLLGWLHGKIVQMVYTERGEARHMISLREATKHESRHYFKTLSRNP